MQDLVSMDELRKVAESERKSITDLSAQDIKMSIDPTKSVAEQAEDVVSAIATARAVSSAETANEITDNKAKELRVKAQTKEKQAETESIRATTEHQKAERDRYEAVLETFGVFKHLPSWLMKILVFIFSPIYIAMNILIGVPCGFVKVLIANVDCIFTRYDDADDKRKPKIRITVWILLALIVLACVTVVLLSIF